MAAKNREKIRLAKAKVYQLQSAASRVLQLQRRFCVTDRAGVQPIGCAIQAAPTDFDLHPYIHLPFSGIHARNPCNYMDYYGTDLPTSGGWKAELACMVG